MSEGLVDVVKFDLERREITMDRFQTGNVANERRSGETTKNDDRVMPLEFVGEGEFVSFKIVSRDLGNRAFGWDLGACSDGSQSDEDCCKGDCFHLGGNPSRNRKLRSGDSLKKFSILCWAKITR